LPAVLFPSRPLIVRAPMPTYSVLLFLMTS
jgi:hypothetical protein